MSVEHSPVDVNGRGYAWPRQPVVVVCVDGSEADYHERAIDAGRMPFLAGVLKSGAALTADCAMPSFTNPNNVSIATGVAPAAHGICGNYFYDPDAGDEVMMNDPSLLRAPTIFAAFAEAGAKVAVITAKDKLRRILGAGLDSGICFSAERADQATAADGGIDDVLGLVDMPLPSVYSSELSEVVLAAGVKVLERERPDVMYLSLTDFIQHKNAPGAPEADDFYAMMDTYFARLDALGAVLVVTADHGMNAKTAADGEPNVVYLQDHLDAWFGEGSSRVILPITDPYVAHHGALGSFATVHLPAGTDRAVAAERLAALPGIDLVLDRKDACARFELPADRVGDVVVISGRNVALGTTPARHDLSQLGEPLRSHGGLTEQNVPFVVNRSLRPLPEDHQLRNYDAFWVGMNYAVTDAARDLA